MKLSTRGRVNFQVIKIYVKSLRVYGLAARCPRAIDIGDVNALCLDDALSSR